MMTELVKGLKGLWGGTFTSPLWSVLHPDVGFEEGTDDLPPDVHVLVLWGCSYGESTSEGVDPGDKLCLCAITKGIGVMDLGVKGGEEFGILFQRDHDLFILLLLPILLSSLTFFDVLMRGDTFPRGEGGLVQGRRCRV